jgi:hypothetical protein
MRKLRFLLVLILLPLGLSGCVVAPAPGYYNRPYAYVAPPPPRRYYYAPAPRPYYGYRPRYYGY